MEQITTFQALSFLPSAMIKVQMNIFESCLTTPTGQVDKLTSEKETFSRTVWETQGELGAVQSQLNALTGQHRELQGRYKDLDVRSVKS